MSAISVHQLTKSFKKGKVPALRGASFVVEPGEIYGIIGPDGAGKTTLFRILAALLLPDSGSATVMGLDVAKEAYRVHQLMGYMPGRFSLYSDLSVEENLQFFASLYGVTVEENYPWVSDVYGQLAPFKDRKAGKLSGGMKQKLALSCVLIHAPKILLLDEPTTGVDPVSRKEFWETLGRLKAKGMTVVVSTPYMDEALLCDRIALMQNGSFLKVNRPQQIIAEYDGRLWAVRSDEMRKLLADLRGLPEVVGAYSFGENLHVEVSDGLEPDELLTLLADLGHLDIRVTPIAPSVEDCFIKLMQPHE